MVAITDSVWSSFSSWAGPRNPPASLSQISWITGIHRHTWLCSYYFRFLLRTFPVILFFKLYSEHVHTIPSFNSACPETQSAPALASVEHACSWAFVVLAAVEHGSQKPATNGFVLVTENNQAPAAIEAGWCVKGLESVAVFWWYLGFMILRSIVT